MFRPCSRAKANAPSARRTPVFPPYGARENRDAPLSAFEKDDGGHRRQNHRGHRGEIQRLDVPLFVWKYWKIPSGMPSTMRRR